MENVPGKIGAMLPRLLDETMKSGKK